MQVSKHLNSWRRIAQEISIDLSINEDLGEAAREGRRDGPLGGRDVLVRVRQLAHDPAGEDLLERAVDHRGREPRVEIGAEAAFRLAALDDPLQRLEGEHDLADLVLELRRAGDLAYEHADEVGVVAPGAE